MAAAPMSGGWTLRMPDELMVELEGHLFPGDRDEHGAVIGATLVQTPRGTRLLGRRLFLAQDGVDYVAGQRGYRMLTAAFVRDCALECAEEGLAYLAVHCHRGRDQVEFSGDDLASHKRGYGALLDILDGPPVGGLVFAQNAVAADIWLPGGERVELDHLEVVDRPSRRLFDQSQRPAHADDRYDRQARLFGDRGQEILSTQKVGVIGAGGAGSLLVEYLARLGVGHLIVIDPDRIDPTNLPRVVDSTRRDTRPLLTHERMPRWLREFGKRRRMPKVDIAEQVARRAQPGIRFDKVFGDVVDQSVAERLIDCDYLFLAADSAQARLVFNALVHQYLIPGFQVGAKAQVDKESGDLLDLFSVVRPVLPGHGCLWCNGLISPAKLQEEATSSEQRRRQRYVDEEDVPAPSVITLNAVAASLAANDYLMSVTGLAELHALRWTKVYPRDRDFAYEMPRRNPNCGECSGGGRLGAGSLRRLPTSPAVRS
jgi:molybdopterin/thiamine biosynthesis adenylyltransferase